MQLAVVFVPRNDGRFGKQVFHYPVRVVKGKKEIDMEVLPLEKGTNFIDEEVWEAMLSHPPNQAEVARLSENRTLAVYKPDAEVPVGSTSDYTSLQTVRAIVENCSPDHKRWLEISLARDTRPEVFKAISTWMTNLDEVKRNRKQQFSFT